MNAIFQFENHENVARRLRQRHLLPDLTSLGIAGDIIFHFQDYLNRQAPGVPVLTPAEVSDRAMQKWESLNPNKTVWILDLDPTAANTPDSSYGLCVLLALAEKHFRLAVQQFLEHPSFLTVVLTLYPANLRQPDGIQRLVRPSCDLTSLHRIWPHVTQIEKQTHSDRTSALTAISKAGPKIVMANSGTDEAWLSSLVSHWLAV